MREPSLTTSPPMIADRPDVDLHVLFGDRRERLLDRIEVRGAGLLRERHLRVTSPLWRATRAR